jgi:dephospho-CoA kinase/inosine/xanthosine triphosphate pyrophosphatase family protein
MLRPKLRTSVLRSKRRPTVAFYTSNIDKFLQARVVFRRAGLDLSHFPRMTSPYEEDYSSSKADLLKKATHDVADKTGGLSIFFIEDTTIRIEALSSEDDVPGLRAKEWFAETTFNDLDKLLQKQDNMRAATVKSDIALYVPGLRDPVIISAETKGRIVDKLPPAHISVRHPWLNTTTFNGWFVPDGADRPLGLMSLEQSWNFDFRIRALSGLLDRLEEYTAILNLSGKALATVRVGSRNLQPALIAPDTVVVVVGKTCAGKTTFSEFLCDATGYAFVEASDVVRELVEEHALSGGTPFLRARRLLDGHGLDVVAKRIIDLYGSSPLPGLVISGFRTIEELEHVKSFYPNVKVVLVHSSERARYERFLERKRDTHHVSIEEFRHDDQQQWSFGLLRVAEDFADIRILNERSEEDLKAWVQERQSLFDERHEGGLSKIRERRLAPAENRIYRCLKALSLSGNAMTCEEVEDASAGTGTRIRFNNVNKVLKNVPELARRIEQQGARVRYEITGAGTAYVRFMEAATPESAG